MLLRLFRNVLLSTFKFLSTTREMRIYSCVCLSAVFYQKGIFRNGLAVTKLCFSFCLLLNQCSIIYANSKGGLGFSFF